MVMATWGLEERDDDLSGIDHGKLRWFDDAGRLSTTGPVNNAWAGSWPVIIDDKLLRD